MSHCTKCGKQNPDTAKFCTGCGTALTAKTVQSAPLTIQQDPEHEKLSDRRVMGKKNIWIIVGIAVVLALGAGAYFLFFKQKKKVAVMMIVPDSLKLRSSKSDIADDNVLGSYTYGTAVTIADSSDVWYSVKLDGKTGYMHSKHLCSPKDFVEIKAIIKSGEAPAFEGAQKLTESRFKKSLLNYFRNHNYIADIPADEREKYFTKDELQNKQVWRIKQGQQNMLTAVKGNFTGSSKKSLAVVIENTTNVKEKKLLVFYYNDDETEAGQNEFDMPGLDYLWVGEKSNEGYMDEYDNYYRAAFDLLRAAMQDNNYPYIFFMYSNGRMEKKYDYEMGD